MKPSSSTRMALVAGAHRLAGVDTACGASRLSATLPLPSQAWLCTSLRRPIALASSSLWADGRVNNASSHARAVQTEPAQSRPQDALSKLNLQRLMRLLAPPTYSGPNRNATTLEEALSDIASWGSGALSSIATRPDQLQAALENYLSSRSISVESWLSIRNAMLADSWPQARRHMINIDDASWPTFVLHHSIRMVSIPSEATDALAVLTSKIQRTASSSQTPGKSFKSLSLCFFELASAIMGDRIQALHLIPRLTDVLLLLLQAFPVSEAFHTSCIVEYVQNCSLHADDRARQAVTKVLLYARSLDNEAQSATIQEQIALVCIESVEHTITRGRRKPLSSDSFVDLELMGLLLELEPVQSQLLAERASRCAVFVAGRERDYRRIRGYFSHLVTHVSDRGRETKASEFLLYAKALARTEQGGQDAIHALLQAEQRLLLSEGGGHSAHPSMAVKKATVQNELHGICIDLLQVMAKSEDVPIERVLSLLGIFEQDANGGIQPAYSTVSASSKAMLRLRLDVYAYTMIMQGCLKRGRSKVALTVWQAMLDRSIVPTTACLSVLLQNLFALQDVSTALQQLNLWCEQGVPRACLGGRNSRDIRVDSVERESVKELDVRSTPQLATKWAARLKVEPDPILASVVFTGLHACGTKGWSSLWTAYRQTIRLFPDGPVLGLVLKASCQAPSSSGLDASFSRQTFRSMLFAKHEELAEYRNPLRHQLEARGPAGWILEHDMSKVERWLASMFSPKQVESPVTASDVAGLVFTSKLFDHYIRLLLHLYHSPRGFLVDSRLATQELIDMLGWMKELHLRPSTTLLALTILEIEERLPPPVAARQMELIDAWLDDWLGAHNLPSQADMQRYWKWKMERNGKSQGWFDRVPSRGGSFASPRH